MLTMADPSGVGLLLGGPRLWLLGQVKFAHDSVKRVVGLVGLDFIGGLAKAGGLIRL